MKKYSDTIEEIEKLLSNLNAQGISIGPLSKSIGELKQHTENIEKVESEIEAIQSEILDPVRKELAKNEQAGRFSIFGFYVGAFGLAISLVALGYSSVTSAKTSKKISELTSEILNKEQSLMRSLPMRLLTEKQSTQAEKNGPLLNGPNGVFLNAPTLENRSVKYKVEFQALPPGGQFVGEPWIQRTIIPWYSPQNKPVKQRDLPEPNYHINILLEEGEVSIEITLPHDVDVIPEESILQVQVFCNIRYPIHALGTR